MGRLLVFAGFGGFGLIALFVEAVADGRATDRGSTSRWRKPAVVFSVLLLLLHGLLAPAALPLLTRHVIPPALADQVFINTLMDESVESQIVVVVNAPSVFHARHIAMMRSFNGQPLPRCVNFLSPSATAVTLTRHDERTLELRADSGYLVVPLDQLFRAQHHPMRQGTVVDVTGMRVRITDATQRGRPLAVEFTFQVPLEDPSLRWLCWRDGTYQSFQPPAVGQTQRIAEPRLSMTKTSSTHSDQDDSAQ